MAKKSMVARETKRKYAVRVRSRCSMCGRPRSLFAPLQAVPHLFPRTGVNGILPGVVKSGRQLRL